MFQFDQVVIDMIWKGIRETLFMTLMSTLMGYVLGLPLGIALAVTDKGGIHPNRVVYRILDVITNVIRSIPFLILLILVIPGNPVYRRPKLWIGSNGSASGDRSGTIYCPHD